MDAILDLTSRAVSIIVVMQDSLLRIKSNQLSEQSEPAPFKLFNDFVKLKATVLKSPFFIENGVKITWISIDPPPATGGPEIYCYDRCLSLISWINSPLNLPIFKERFQNSAHFPAPEQWREAIREVLYTFPEGRIQLADAIQYLPVQIVLTVKEIVAQNARAQRLLQIWNCSEDDLENIISSDDRRKYNELSKLRLLLESPDPSHPASSENQEHTASMFLKNEKQLIDKLKENSVPLSFLQMFNRELMEIGEARKARRTEILDSHESFQPMQSGSTNKLLTGREATFEEIFKSALTDNSAKYQKTSENDIDEEPNPFKTSKVDYIPDCRYTHTFDKDVLKSAGKMELWALAFSGGGIRSATFNLGILQGLAKKGLISKFDYLSTVSGGGYIGTWLVSWISRNRSVTTISDRLDPEKSSDPFAEEVRPIRWLRMYSNFLTPSAGIMSPDSWTAGMIIIRNMLVNQLVILLLLLSLISIGWLTFLVWLEAVQYDYPFLEQFESETCFNVISSLFLITGAILAGLAMHTYQDNKDQRINIRPAIRNRLSNFLIFICCLAAWALSIWIYRHSTIADLSPKFDSFKELFNYFTWIMIISFLGLIGVAALGRYDRCIDTRTKNQGLEIFWGTLLTLAAVLFGGIILVYVCQAGAHIASHVHPLKGVEHFLEKLAFIFLPPVIIEVLSVTIVLRMAFLSSSFPDERREWWGRIGGLIHRLSLIWIVVFSLTMFGESLLDLLNTKIENIKGYFAVGWGAILVAGLRFAYNGTTSGNEADKRSTSPIKETLALCAPYLFVIAMMIFLPQLLIIIQKISMEWLPESMNGEFWSILVIAVVLVVITFISSVRIGVNQFSMHLFYRNRLVRAYLGATRIRLERQRSANPFTGFDRTDDIQLKDFTCENEYFGPYLLINTTLSASSNTVLDRQDRKAESFMFSPLYCGYDFSKTRDSANILKKSYDYAYRPTDQYAYEGGPHIGTAMAISGAAVNPNMGYHSSAATAFLLSVFNIRLGWWMGNPRMAKWREADPHFGLSYLISDLIGNTSTKTNFICLSDGAHFDNMGLYELIRRKCRYIILSDAEQDEKCLCEGLANAVRRCRIDFGVEITFSNIEGITDLNEKHFSKKNFAVGKITYPLKEDQDGFLIYIKASITEKESVDLQEYAKKNQTFPHQSTADQFFREEQFESYRKLGMNIVDKLFGHS